MKENTNSRVYTKAGDLGTTQLLSGERVAKNHPRIIALGCLDETTSHLGKIKSLLTNQRIKESLEKIQTLLIQLMSSVATSTTTNCPVKEEDVSVLEHLIDYYSEYIGGFKGFVLPGTTKLSAEIDIARTVVRRAEASLNECEVMPTIRAYINRLSDYLYILARYVEIEHKPQGTLGLRSKITREDANKVIEQVMEFSQVNDCRVVVAIVTAEGNPISVQVAEGAFLVSYEMAMKKAFTAAALKMPTHELAVLTQKGAEFEGLANMLEAKIVTLGGGYPLYSGDQVIGAIGVSGGSAGQDIAFAEYGMQVFKKEE